MRRFQMKMVSRKGLATVLAAGLVFGPLGVAGADQISNNLDASVDADLEVMSLTAGGSTGSTQLRVIPQNNDGKQGCNLTGGTTLVVNVVSSDTSTATVSTGSLTFTSCGDVHTVTVSPQAAGATTVSLSQVSNNTGGSFDLGPAAFTVNVAAATVTPSPNQSPQIATKALDRHGIEGDTLSTGGAFSDPDGDPLTITRLSGPGTVTQGVGGSWSWSLATTDNVSGSVTVQADDGRGGTITDTFNFSARNADPVVGPVSVSLDGACQVSVFAPFSDTGSADTHTAVIDWDDGNTTNVEPATTPVTGSHTYTAAGMYTVNVAVTDNDLGTGNGAASPITTRNTASAILDPIKANGASTFKAGSSIPIKITVKDCGNHDVSTLTPLVDVIKVDTTASDELSAGGVTATPTNGKNMTWDGASQYVYVLSSKKSQFSGAAMGEGTYRVTVSDPTIVGSASQRFDIKK